MKYYRPIASYDGAGDIKELFPFDITRKLEAATNVVNYYLNGKGNPHEIAGDDEEARIYPDEMDEYGLVPVIGNYAVSFIPGDKEVLFGGKKETVGYENHGYFIDIYQLTDTEELTQDITNEELVSIAEKREQENRAIKEAIIREFKARFTKPGTGLDFYTYASADVEGMGNSVGTIGKMTLNLDGEIQVSLIGEYEDDIEDFEDAFFYCSDWPQLLLNVRLGIRDEWWDEDDDDEPDYPTDDDIETAYSNQLESDYFNYGPEKPGHGWMEAEEN